MFRAKGGELITPDKLASTSDTGPKAKESATPAASQSATLNSRGATSSAATDTEVPLTPLGNETTTPEQSTSMTASK